MPVRTGGLAVSVGKVTFGLYAGKHPVGIELALRKLRFEGVQIPCHLALIFSLMRAIIRGALDFPPHCRCNRFTGGKARVTGLPALVTTGW